MKRLHLPLLILFFILSSCAEKDSFDGFTRTVIYRQGDYDSKFYRIPAIITAKDGSLVIFTDKRKENEVDLPEDIDILVNIADTQNIIVMCYGLLVDYNEQMFPTSKRLIEVGAKLHQLKSNCQIEGCMNLSDHHLLFDSKGNVVKGGTGIQLGDTIYKSVCRKHFNEFYYKKR